MLALSKVANPRHLPAAVCALGLSIVASGALARDAGGLGGGGGGEYRSPCPANMAWFAYIGRAGSALDGIRALCTSVQPNKTTTGTFETDYHGGGGGDRIQRTCPANSVVTAMRVWMGNDRLVSKIDLTCTNLQDGSTSVQAGRTGGRPIEPSVLFSCNPDEVGVGIYGRSGAMIDNIGLICERLAVVQPGTVAQKQTPTTKPPPPDTTPACNLYADRMVAHANELIALKCNTQSLGAGLKTTNRDEYFRNCKSIGPDQTKYNENPVLDVLAKCKAGGGTAVTKTVVAEVTMYDKPVNGNDVCYLNANDKVTVLTGAEIPAAFRNPGDPKWTPVRGNSGGCNGKVGGVYNDGKLK